MQTRNFRVSFLTPAFLGNAEQDGQWRTPPFKHLLREWWRVAWCEANDFSDDYRTMREAEGSLFGSAADGTGRRSRVRMRLDKWDRGQLTRGRWPSDARVIHPEVTNRQGEPVPVGSALYLGYGPSTYDNQRRDTALKANAVIQAGELAELRLAFPGSDGALLGRTLSLIDAFGTLGGRSRNGWGSLRLDNAPALKSLPLRDWRGCLDRDWPHAIGKDETGPLVWQTKPHDDWESLMRTLAIVKIGLRTQFRFHSRNNAPQPEARHWLSYPVTNHYVVPWDKAARRARLGNRLPNSLRFKVVKDADGRLRGQIFHMPHLPPAHFRPNPHRQTIEDVWRCVHQFLDALTQPPNARHYCAMADQPTLDRQRDQVKGVRLERIQE